MEMFLGEEQIHLERTLMEHSEHRVQDQGTRAGSRTLLAINGEGCARGAGVVQ